MDIFETLLAVLKVRKESLEEEIGTGLTGGGNADNELEYDCVLSIEQNILKEAEVYWTRNRWEEEDRPGN